MEFFNSKNRYWLSYSKFNYACDVLDIPIQRGLLDVIICTEALEHAPEPISICISVI